MTEAPIPTLTGLMAAALAAFAALTAAAEPDFAGLRLPQERGALLAATEELDLWLDTHTDLPRSAIPLARVELVPPGAEIRHEGRMTVLGGSVRGAYDAGTATIYLVRQWFGDTAHDRGVLLHEMVHHRYCPQAMEWDAYLIQEKYLNALGETGAFNWAWVLLASSCAVRDHHPE